MAKGFIISIGLNKLDKKHYDNWDGALSVCEKDAKDMVKFLQKKGFSDTNTTLLLTKEATRKNVLGAIEKVQAKAKAGDMVVIYYSGHGGNEIPDTNRDEDDPYDDAYDESWCLYDGQLIDDELYLQWIKFEAGTRIVLMSDSCFSGDVMRMALKEKPEKNKAMPRAVGLRTYQNNKSLYDKLVSAIEKESKQKSKVKLKDNVKASLLFMSSSQEYQPSIPETEKYPKNSLFTAVFLETANQKEFATNSYEKLINAVSQAMPSKQKPNYQLLGKNKAALIKEKLFTI